MLRRTAPGFRRSDNLHRRRPATWDQDRDDRDGDRLDRRLSLPSWTTRCAKSCASSSPSPAFALMRSMIPRPSRRAASSTSESRRPIRAARTRTWRMSPSSIESVVFTFPIFPYCHTEVEFGWLNRGRPRQRPLGVYRVTEADPEPAATESPIDRKPNEKWPKTTPEPRIAGSRWARGCRCSRLRPRSRLVRCQAVGFDALTPSNDGWQAAELPRSGRNRHRHELHPDRCRGRSRR
jgi:hypothetical protein